MGDTLTDGEMKAYAARILKDAPRPGLRVTHYKGGEYEVVAAALTADGHHPVVCYRCLSTGVAWVRPLAEFLDPARFTPNPRRYCTNRSCSCRS